MEAKFTLTPSLTEEDYMAFCEESSKRTTRFMHFLIIASLILGCLTMILIYCLKGEISIIALVTTVVMVILPLFYLSIRIMARRRAFRSNKLTADGAKCEYNFFDDHFTVTSIFEKASMPYSKLHKITLVPEYAFLYINLTSAFIIHDNNPDFIDFISEIKSNYNL